MGYYKISNGPQPTGRVLIIAEDHPFVGAEAIVVGTVPVNGLLLDVDGIDVRVPVNAVEYLNKEVPVTRGRAISVTKAVLQLCRDLGKAVAILNVGPMFGSIVFIVICLSHEESLYWISGAAALLLAFYAARSRKSARTLLHSMVALVFFFSAADEHWYNAKGISWASRNPPSHVDFIRQTSDLPSSVQLELDKIYKVDPTRARELSRMAHESGLQDLQDVEPPK